MIGDSTKVVESNEKYGNNIIFGDDINDYTIRYGLISKNSVIINSIALVDGLKHNFLSISQLCDKGNEVWFNK